MAVDSDILSNLLAEVERAFHEAIAEAQDGPDRMVKVVLCPDGTAYASESVGRERGPDEYYAKVPHPLTVWESQTRAVRDDDDEPQDAIDISTEAWSQLHQDIERAVADWVTRGNLTVTD